VIFYLVFDEPWSIFESNPTAIKLIAWKNESALLQEVISKAKASWRVENSTFSILELSETLAFSA
jgi:hypothetical protein